MMMYKYISTIFTLQHNLNKLVNKNRNMSCNKLNGKILKVKTKVSGFLIAKIEKRTIPEKVTVIKKRNTILSTGLQNLINAFGTYMSGINYSGEKEQLTGIVITTSSGQQLNLQFVNTPSIYLENNSVMIMFTVKDNSTNSYTATSEELITTSAGYNIPIATANISVTKNSDEILTLTWIITINITVSGNIIYIPTLTPQSAYATGVGHCYSGCNLCSETNANSLFSGYCVGVFYAGVVMEYPNTSFITTQLFTDMFYNNYNKAPTNSFIQITDTTITIYTLYCSTYFDVGIAGGNGNFTSSGSGYGTICYTTSISFNPIYIHLYIPTEIEPYVGVQIEFTT